MLPIRFKPFIGKYFQTQEFKILILGESHYFCDKDYSDYLNEEKRIKSITIEVVNRFLDFKKTGENSEKWMKTYTSFSNVFNGKRQSNPETIDFWESCSFYNYVQAPTKGTRISPMKEEFDLSFNAFKHVVEEINPNLIFFWGYRLWDNFPKDNYRSLTKGADKIHFLTLNSNFPIMVVPHPSSSKFNYGITEEIKNYINTVKNFGNNV